MRIMAIAIGDAVPRTVGICRRALWWRDTFNRRCIQLIYPHLWKFQKLERFADPRIIVARYVLTGRRYHVTAIAANIDVLCKLRSGDRDLGCCWIFIEIVRTAAGL